MRKIKEKRMQSYVLRARKMVQEGKNKEGAEMLSEGLNYYSKNIIKALTPYATADAGIISMVLRNLADGIEKDNPGAKELRISFRQRAFLCKLEHLCEKSENQSEYFHLFKILHCCQYHQAFCHGCRLR